MTKSNPLALREVPISRRGGIDPEYNKAVQLLILYGLKVCESNMGMEQS